MERKAKRPDKYLKKHAGAEKLRVAAYCRVSTDSEEQASSLVLQEAHFTNLINGVSVWSNAGCSLSALPDCGNESAPNS